LAIGATLDDFCAHSCLMNGDLKSATTDTQGTLDNDLIFSPQRNRRTQEYKGKRGTIKGCGGYWKIRARGGKAHGLLEETGPKALEHHTRLPSQGNLASFSSRALSPVRHWKDLWVAFGD
jgi:hypothetical protein